MYYPYYGAALGSATPKSTISGPHDGNLAGFVSTTTLSFSVSALDAAAAIDALLANGTSYISISSRPDPQAIEAAQMLAVTMAVSDGLFKAQAALTRLNLCALNFTLVNVENPISLLPAVNIVSNNFGVSLGGNFGLNVMPAASASAPSTPSSTSSTGTAATPNDSIQFNSVAGAGRSLVSARVWLTLYHGSCSAAGAIQDLTTNLSLAAPLPSLPNQGSESILGSSAILPPVVTPPLPIVSSALPASSALASSGSFSGSGSGSDFGPARMRRAFW